MLRAVLCNVMKIQIKYKQMQKYKQMHRAILCNVMKIQINCSSGFKLYSLGAGHRVAKYIRVEIFVGQG